MKTFAKRLKAERTQNSILRRENEILKKLLRNKNTELKKGESPAVFFGKVDLCSGRDDRGELYFSPNRLK